jgi:DNA-binding transcriptional LysR family regulator
VLAELEQAEGAARGTDSFTGVPRVATPVTFGAREIAPRLGAFIAAHHGGETSVKLGARLVATSTEGVFAAAAAGLGIAATSLFACRAELDRGEFVRVLDRHTLALIDVHAVFPAGRRTPAKARAFVDHVAATLS